MNPEFFKIGFSNDVDHGAPWTLSLTAARVGDDPQCALCRARGIERWHFEGPAVADGVFGRSWGDIIGAGSGPMAGPTFMVSERVVEKLEAARIHDLTAYPVEVRRVDTTHLKRKDQPRYFHLHIKRGIWADFVSAKGPADVCENCGAIRGYFEIARELPRPGTWNGADLFEAWNTVGPFCTEKVLLLARQHRWANFIFEPFDLPQQRTVPWKGIDYLGRTWPPKWYPDRPSAGRTLEEWLADYFIEPKTKKEYRRFWLAERALEDLGIDALPALIERFSSGSARAARGIHAIAEAGAPIPKDLHDRVEQVVFEREYELDPRDFVRDKNGRLRRKPILPETKNP